MLERAGSASIMQRPVAAVLIFVFPLLVHAGFGQPTIGFQQRLDSLGPSPGTNETSASAVLSASNVNAVAAWNDGTTVNVTGTANGGSSWSVPLAVTFPDSNDVADPMTARDPRTGTLWVGGYGKRAGSPPVNDDFIWIAKWNGVGFDPPVIVRDNIPDVDKPFMAAGPKIGTPDSTRLHVVYWDQGSQYVIWSDNLGASGTWQGPVQITPASPLELFVDGPCPRVGPNGELYVVSADAGAAGAGFGVWLHRALTLDAFGAPILEPGIRIATRLDTWGHGGDCSRIPGHFRVPNRAYLAVDPVDGTLYCVYMDTTRMLCSFPSGSCVSFDVDVYFTRSGDQGTTWTVPKVINGVDTLPYDQFFPWIEVDEDHRLHLVFYDTLGASHTDQDAEAQLRTRYAYSTNAGNSWVEQTIAPYWSGAPATWPTVHAWGFIGDYNGMAFSSQQVFPVYMASLGPENTTTPRTRIYTNLITWP